MKVLMSNLAIDYELLEKERNMELQQQLDRQLKEKTLSSGAYRGDGMRASVLRYVVDSNYESAYDEINRYLEYKSSYPSLGPRVAPYVSHCKDIIKAIEAKRNIPGITTLSTSKQQEIFENIEAHFDELKHYLKKIEVIDADVRLDDLRSTVWVVKCFFYSLFIILSVGFLKEIVFGMHDSFNIVFDDLVLKVLNAFLSLF